MRTKTFARNLANLTLTKKAHDVTILDLRNITDITDYFVICSGDSDIQVKSIADAVLDGAEEKGIKVWKMEGITERQWIILDYVDVVVHIFLKEVRKFYNLDKLWGDAKSEIIEDKPAVKSNTTKRTKKKVERVSKK